MTNEANQLARELEAALAKHGFYHHSVERLHGENHEIMEAPNAENLAPVLSAIAGPEIEEIGVCVGCNAFLRVGEVVTPWDDEVGHYNCDDPFSLARQPHLDADLDIPEPMVLLGSPALYIPLTALRPPAANVEGASDAVEAAAYAPPGLQYASVDQSDCWLLRFSDVDCGDQWFGGDDYTPEEARQLAIDAWNRYAPAWSVRLMRTVTLDEVRATQDQHK